ncbi:MAG: nucleotide pyrophosphohydrolase [Thermogutta sp.]|nr:nucleotide pyrophosphohydrolase [Thermogutta sp.]
MTSSEQSPFPVSDATTPVARLREIVERFVQERSWEPFHTPKNLVMALAVEAAELMEHFQWLTPEQGEAVAQNPEQREAVADEMADVFCYLLALSSRLGIDLTTAVLRKMEKNVQKYPAEIYRGYFGPEDPRWPGPGSSPASQ